MTYECQVPEVSRLQSYSEVESSVQVNLPAVQSVSNAAAAEAISLASRQTGTHSHTGQPSVIRSNGCHKYISFFPTDWTKVDDDEEEGRRGCCAADAWQAMFLLDTHTTMLQERTNRMMWLLIVVFLAIFAVFCWRWWQPSPAMTRTTAACWSRPPHWMRGWGLKQRARRTKTKPTQKCAKETRSTLQQDQSRAEEISHSLVIRLLFLSHSASFPPLPRLVCEFFSVIVFEKAEEKKEFQGERPMVRKKGREHAGALPSSTPLASLSLHVSDSLCFLIFDRFGHDGEIPDERLTIVLGCADVAGRMRRPRDAVDGQAVTLKLSSRKGRSPETKAAWERREKAGSTKKISKEEGEKRKEAKEEGKRREMLLIGRKGRSPNERQRENGAEVSGSCFRLIVVRIFTVVRNCAAQSSLRKMRQNPERSRR